MTDYNADKSEIWKEKNSTEFNFIGWSRCHNVVSPRRAFVLEGTSIHTYYTIERVSCLITQDFWRINYYHTRIKCRRARKYITIFVATIYVILLCYCLVCGQIPLPAH